MSKIIDNYNLVNEGRMAKSEFLRQARQGFPGYINQFTSFDDAISIFRRKGILTEDVEYQCKGDKFPLESIERGIDYELEQMGIRVPFEIPGQGDYKIAKMKTIDNLCKDPLYYIKKVACCCDKCKSTQEEAEAKKGKDYKQKKAEGQMAEVTPGQKKVKPLQESKEDHKTYVDKEGKKHYYRDGKWYWCWADDKAEDDVRGSIRADFQKGSRPNLDERWGGDDDAAWAAGNGANEKALSTFVNWAKKNKGTRTMPADGVDSEAIDGIQFTWRRRENPRRDWDTWRLDIDYDSWFNKLRGPQTNWDGKAHSVTPLTSCQDICTFDEWDSIFTGLYNTVNESAYTEKRKSFTEDDKISIQLVQAIMKKTNPETGKKYTQAEAKKKAAKMIKAHKKKEEVKESKQNISDKLLREGIEKAIVKVLSEAATNNLAALSDQNANIQELPGILNSLENIVTEIESFIIKEHSKIQSVFDSIGNIKNEDNIPVGYKFIQPILDSLKQDLEPVLAKVTLDDLNLPEAPQESGEGLNPGMPNNEPGMPVDKQTVFSPKGAKPQLAESRTKRYTK